jgi:hypothetical protein
MHFERDAGIVKSRVEEAVRKSLGSSSFSIDGYLREYGVEEFPGLSLNQRRQFVEDLSNRVISGHLTPSRANMARMQLLSVLGVDLEPWKITGNYVPSPREYLLSDDMRRGFERLKRRAIKDSISKFRVNAIGKEGEKVRSDMLSNVIREVLGNLPRATLEYSDVLFGRRPFEHVLANNLAAYMRRDDALKAGREVVKVVGVSGDGVGGLDRSESERLSKAVMEDFIDTNQVVIRTLKNQLNISSMEKLRDSKRRVIFEGMMSHYFGGMSENFLDHEVRILKYEDQQRHAPERTALADAIIHDCLQSSMKREHARRTHEELLSLIGGG